MMMSAVGLALQLLTNLAGAGAHTVERRMVLAGLSHITLLLPIPGFKTSFNFCCKGPDHTKRKTKLKGTIADMMSLSR